jgi:hypothetical protein
VFAEKFKGSSKGNKAMIYGQMLHRIFQATLAKRQEVGVAFKAHDFVMEEVRNTLSHLDSLEQLYMCSLCMSVCA